VLFPLPHLPIFVAQLTTRMAADRSTTPTKASLDEMNMLTRTPLIP
jgi:hypothetical protein